MKSLLIWLWLAQGADTSTTLAALHRGCVERTYWTGNPAWLTAGKLAGTVTLTWGGPRLKGGTAVVVGAAAAASVAAVLNARTLPGCGR